MALITSRTGLNQGASTIISDAVFGSGTTGDIKITSALAELPDWSDGEFFEIREHSNSQNNGLYQVETVTTATEEYECDKVTGAAPITAVAEAMTTLGASGIANEKSVHLDLSAKKVYLIEQGNLSADGVTGGAIYSFFMQEWKDDNYVIANAPFPMNAIDTDAGKYIIGQDSSGNNNGWNWSGDSGFTPNIRTRKLLRNMGWDEVDADGITIAREFCYITLGTFEDSSADTPFYQFGTDTTVDDTVDIDFAGPANEAIRFYEEQAQVDLVIADTTTITRATGSFIDEGYKVGGQVTIRAAEDGGNDGDWVLTAVTSADLTTSGLTNNADDTTARLSVNNDNAFRNGIRVRDVDPYGKTFGEANLASAGKTALGNFVFAFPLANATDLKISETDANIDSQAPYTGMNLTLYGTGQSRGGLVGGPYNFGMIMDGNNGTNIQCFEWLQRQLRKNSDIDSGAGVNFGRALGLMARFNGDTAEIGSGDGGLNFPTNPEGGGSGLFIDNLNAASDNDTKFYDNTGTIRSKPESIAVTLDFNSIVTGDAASEYDMYFDRTIRTAAGTLTDLAIANADSSFTSGTSALPINAEIANDKYIRITGLTGVDEPMNGVWQITAINNAGHDWSVVRYDGIATGDVNAAAVDLDQNCVDTPDAILVHTNINVATADDVYFTASDTISSSAAEFGVFGVGDRIEIENSTDGLNDGLWEVLTASASVITVSAERTSPAAITTQASAPIVTITKIFSGDADADVVANFAFDDNVQGGRTVSVTTYVQGKAIGASSSQYIESPVSSIASGTPLTIPLFAATERNYS